MKPATGGIMMWRSSCWQPEQRSTPRVWMMTPLCMMHLIMDISRLETACYLSQYRSKFFIIAKVPFKKNCVCYLCQVVKLLLRYGGDPRQSNRRGETPLMVANSPTMLNLLLGKGTYTSSEESSSGVHGQILVMI